MVDALARLMEEGRFTRCIDTADQMLRQGGWSPAQMAAIHLISCRCRLQLQDVQGAVEAGQAAVRLAQQEGQYDLLGRALLNLGTAHAALQQYDQALRCFFDYFTHMPHYQEARRLEGAVWKHLGVTYQRRLEPEKAAYALEEAQRWFAVRQIDHGAFTSRHDLINVYLYMSAADRSKLVAVRRLLFRQQEIARRYPTEPYYTGTYLLDVSAWLLRSGRPVLAAVAASEALAVWPDDPVHAFHCHLVLHHCALARESPRLALGHVLAACSAAVAAADPQLERLATEILGDLVEREGVAILRELGRSPVDSVLAGKVPLPPPLRRNLQ